MEAGLFFGGDGSVKLNQGANLNLSEEKVQFYLLLSEEPLPPMSPEVIHCTQA